MSNRKFTPRDKTRCPRKIAFAFEMKISEFLAEYEKSYKI